MRVVSLPDMTVFLPENLPPLINDSDQQVLVEHGTIINAIIARHCKNGGIVHVVELAQEDAGQLSACGTALSPLAGNLRATLENLESSRSTQKSKCFVYWKEQTNPETKRAYSDTYADHLSRVNVEEITKRVQEARVWSYRLQHLLDWVRYHTSFLQDQIKAIHYARRSNHGT